MATINPNFKLKIPKSETPTLIYLIIYYNKVRFVYSTGLSIKPEFWKNTEDRPYLKNAESGFTGTLTKQEIIQAAQINNQLTRFKTETAKIFDHLNYQQQLITNKILKTEYDKIFRQDAPEKKPKEPEVLNLNSYIEKFIQDIKSGKRITEKSTRYSEGTIKNYLGFQTQLNNIQAEHRRQYNFDQITIDFYDKYVAFFNAKNYSPNTIGRHVKNMKVIIRAAKEDGLTQNQDIERKKFKAITVEINPVYLTEKELQTIYNLDLSEFKTLEVARDIFLIGCYTAQRFSDFSRINSEHIKEIKGGKIIDLIQKKTGEQVLIPIRPELEIILKKYDYKPPRIYEQKMNERIKLVCGKADIKELIAVEEIKGGLKVSQMKPKCDLIKTHTARRTGATLMFLAGIPSISIMKITGHKTEREFLKYIRVTKEQNAETLINHAYFIGTPLKLVK